MSWTASIYPKSWHFANEINREKLKSSLFVGRRFGKTGMVYHTIVDSLPFSDEQKKELHDLYEKSFKRRRMNYYLTKEELDVIKNDKQFILVRGKRRIGKTFISFIFICEAVFSDERKDVFVILPTIRHTEVFISDFLSFLGTSTDYIRCINRKCSFIDFFNGSRIYLLTPSIIFDYQLRGYPRPELIVIDDASVFEEKIQKKIFRLLKKNHFWRNWNCKYYISYYPFKKLDKLQSLYRFANKYWYKKTLGGE